jgi:hypothetical protein
MSATSTAKTEIAAAITAGVPASVVRCGTKYRQTTRPGDAWPRLAARNRAANGFGYLDTWEVVVVLPQDLGAAEEWLDAHLDELLEALNVARVFVRGVETATPTELILGAGNPINGLILTGLR